MPKHKPLVEVQASDPQPYKCRCGYEWFPRRRGERPRVCPHCKSANWDRPYKFRRRQLSNTKQKKANKGAKSGGNDDV